MIQRAAIPIALFIAPPAGLSAADKLVVYAQVPGLAASQHYKARAPGQ